MNSPLNQIEQYALGEQVNIFPHMEIPCARVAFVVRMDVPDPVSGFLEATIRGGMGIHLRDQVCIFPDTDCGGCILAGQCPHAILFTSSTTIGQVLNQGGEATPRPIMVRCSQVGNLVRAEFTLFGKAIPLVPTIAKALQSVVTFGLGKRKLTGNLESIVDLFGAKRWDKPSPSASCPIARHLALPSFEESMEEPSANLHIDFESPFCLKAGGRLIDGYDHDAFLLALVRRTSLLAQVYGNFEGRYNVPFLGKDWRGVGSISHLHTVSQVRYSTRQESTIELVGSVGSLWLDNVPGWAQALLKLGETLGVGKGTAFGMGRYRILKGDE